MRRATGIRCSARRSAADRRPGLPEDLAAPLPLPATASDAIRRRIAMLEPRTRDVLLAAAALPRPTVVLLVAAHGERMSRARSGGSRGGDRRRRTGSNPLHASAGRSGRVRGRHAGAAPCRTRPARTGAVALRGTCSAPCARDHRPSAAVAAEVEAAAAAARARGALDTAGRLLEQSAAVTPVRERAARRRRGLEAARCHLAAGDTDHARRLLDRLVEAVESRRGTGGGLARARACGWDVLPEGLRIRVRSARAGARQPGARGADPPLPRGPSDLRRPG